MSRYSNTGSYGHKIRNLGDGCYRISWKTDRYYSGSRLRYPQVRSRDTDLVGARRFAKRWGVTIPELPEPSSF